MLVSRAGAVALPVGHRSPWRAPTTSATGEIREQMTAPVSQARRGDRREMARFADRSTGRNCRAERGDIGDADGLRSALSSGHVSACCVCWGCNRVVRGRQRTYVGADGVLADGRSVPRLGLGLGAPTTTSRSIHILTPHLERSPPRQLSHL